MTKNKSIILSHSYSEICMMFSCFNFCYCYLLQNCRSHLWLFCLWSLGRCKQRTTSGKCCVLPFKYRGRSYNRCAKTRRGRPWCPTGSSVYIRNQPWGYCRGGKRKEQYLFDFLSFIFLSLPLLLFYEFAKKSCTQVLNESRDTICCFFSLCLKCYFCNMIFKLDFYFEV